MPEPKRVEERIFHPGSILSPITVLGLKQFTQGMISALAAAAAAAAKSL